MKQNIIILLLVMSLIVLVLILASTTPSHQTTQSVPIDPVILTYQKTPCFGFCPVYQVTLHQSGQVVIQAEQNMPDDTTSGIYQRQISPQKQQEIFQDAEQMSFWHLSPVYDANVTDLPSTVIQITHPVTGQSHQVTARANVPEHLSSFLEGLHQTWMSVL